MSDLPDISKRKRCPSHPGAILKDLYLDETGLTITALAKILGVTRATTSRIIHAKNAVSINMAMRLSRTFKTTPDLWINLQSNFDLWHECHDKSD
jgi:antitoxin HigA-1